MSEHIDDIGAENLARACHAYAQRNPTHRIATMAYIQALMCQNVCQVLVTTLLRKNMLSDADLQRMLAEAYDEAANRIKVEAGLIAPTPALIRPKN